MSHAGAQLGPIQKPSAPTILVVHHRERRSKCTIEPLRTNPEFEFWKYPLKQPHSLTGYVRLGLGGPLISPEDRQHGLLVLDGTWRWAEKMEATFFDLPVRSLPDWKTAYPRASKLQHDPSGGLATIEAIFAAYFYLGYSTAGLLDQYYWRESFLEMNSEYFGEMRQLPN